MDQCRGRTTSSEFWSYEPRSSHHIFRNRPSTSPERHAPKPAPAKAGVQLGNVADWRCASSPQPTQLGPGLRRGGVTWQHLGWLWLYGFADMSLCVAGGENRLGLIPFRASQPPRRRPGANWTGCSNGAQRNSAPSPNWAPASAGVVSLWAGGLTSRRGGLPCGGASPFEGPPRKVCCRNSGLLGRGHFTGGRPGPSKPKIASREGGTQTGLPPSRENRGGRLQPCGPPVPTADLHDPPPPGGGGWLQPDGGGGSDNLGSVSAPSVACGATSPWRETIFQQATRPSNDHG